MNSLIAKLFIFIVEVVSVLVLLLVMLAGTILVVRGELLTGAAVAVGGTVAVALVFGFGAILIEIHKNIAAMRLALDSKEDSLRLSARPHMGLEPTLDPPVPPLPASDVSTASSDTNPSPKNFIEAEYARYRYLMSAGVDVKLQSQKEEMLVAFYSNGLRTAGFTVEEIDGAAGRWRLINNATQANFVVRDLFDLSRYFARYAS